jgi:hypothetical protein
MPSKEPQSLANHTKFDPPFHFLLIPASVILLITLIVQAVRHPGKLEVFLLAWMVVFIIGLFKTRIYGLRVQDRVIRLEERLRLAMLLPERLRARIPELKVSQLIGLRFASDAELPALAERALNENLSKAEIKRAINDWRADHWRI